MKEVLEEKLPYVNSFVLVKKKMMKPKFNYVVSLPFLLFRLLFSSCFYVVKHKTSEAFGYMFKNNSYFLFFFLILYNFVFDLYFTSTITV